MTRIVYNRVMKAGSTTMFAVLHFLGKKNNFTVVKDQNVFPDRVYLLKTLQDLPDNTVYINHCQYIEDESIKDYVWINMVRDPIDREQSSYYYEVSAERFSALKELERRDRKVDPCGCMHMEFDDCYRFYAETANCTDRLKLHGFVEYFGDAPPNPVGQITHEKIYERIRDRYLFVGLLEEFNLSVKVLEHMLPHFFKGASAYFRRLPNRHNLTPQVNPLTNTTKTGAITNHVREVLKHYNHDEMVLYEHVKRLFWLKVVTIFPNLTELPINKL